MSEQQTEPLRTFRDAIRELVPTWLRGTVGGGILYAVAVQLDAITDAARAGVKARFPGLTGYESLGITGRERRIRRGRTESDATYATRMLRWLDDHQRRGGPYALLAQLFAHYAPTNFRIDLVYRSGRRFKMATDGTIVRDDIGSFAFVDWSHWTLYFFWPEAAQTDGVWGDPGTWGDGGTWGSSLTVEEVADLRLIPREWNAAHCSGRVVLLQEGGELWGYPDGTWGDPGVWLGPSEYPVTFSIG